MGCDRREVVTAFRAEALAPVSCSACAQVLGLCSRVSLLMLGIVVTVSAGFLYEAANGGFVLPCSTEAGGLSPARW